MSEQLYRWVKATEALPPAGSEVKMKWDDPDNEREWHGDPVTELRDIRQQYYHKLLWQQPIPSLNAGSLEQDFKEINVYLNDLYHNMTHNVKDAGHLWIAFTDKFNAFRERVLAGAAYVKGGEELPEGLDDPFPTRDVLRILINATEILLDKKNYDGPDHEEIFYCVKRAKEILSLPSRPSLDIDKVVEQLKEANPFNAWSDHEDISENADKWNEAVNTIQELLNQK